MTIVVYMKKVVIKDLVIQLSLSIGEWNFTESFL